jgi:hypothetical protein
MMVGSREKDGLWAVLAWLSILAHANAADRKQNLGDKIKEGDWSPRFIRAFLHWRDWDKVPETYCIGIPYCLFAIPPSVWSFSFQPTLGNIGDAFLFWDALPSLNACAVFLLFFLQGGLSHLYLTVGLSVYRI